MWRSRTCGARGTPGVPAPDAPARIPLIRDETGAVITRAAHWLPPDEDAATVHGEATVDDTLLFDGDIPGVLIEPTVDRAGSAGQRDVVPHAREALGRGSRCPARHRRRVGRSGRGGRKTAGSPVDVLSTHRGLAVGSVASNRERPAAAPPVIGAPQPSLPGDRRADRASAARWPGSRPTRPGRWPTSASSRSSSPAGW